MTGPSQRTRPPSLEAGRLRSHFDTLHAASEDPWGATTRWYEIRKRSVTMASLPDAHYDETLEIGCSIGALTEELALRSGHVLAVDLSPQAVLRATTRLSGLTHVDVRLWDMARGFPEGSFDLIVLSEVGYYLASGDLASLARNVSRTLSPGGALVACHWRHDESDFVQTGDAVHATLLRETGLVSLVHHAEADFVLDVLALDSGSVATGSDLA